MNSSSRISIARELIFLLRPFCCSKGSGAVGTELGGIHEGESRSGEDLRDDRSHAGKRLLRGSGRGAGHYNGSYRAKEC